VRVLAATPHVRDDYPTEAATMERLLGETREAVRAAGVGIELVPGGEIAIGMLGELGDDELAAHAARIRPTRKALRYFDQVEWDS